MLQSSMHEWQWYHQAALDASDTGNLAAAALLEETTASCVPDDKPRTCGILCRSAVSLWLAAGDRDHAIALGKQYLEDGSLLPGFTIEIRDLLASTLA